MVDKNWSRWIAASINQHFKVDGLDTFFEGDDWDKVGRTTSYAEVRIDGPNFEEFSGYSKAEVTVNIMCSAYTNQNIYELNRVTGIFHELMIPIIVKKYGNGPDDDQSVIGCLTLRDRIRTDTFGQSAVDTKITLASVEGDYEVELSA